MDRDKAAVRSIADLASLAGVSISTVSRALTGKGTLNLSTRERIRALAAEHDFQLNVSAQNLRLGRTGAIAVLLPLGHARSQALSDPFFSTMLGHLADAMIERGYDLLLSRVVPDTPDWLDVFVRSGRVDGVIVIGQSDQSAAINRTGAHYQPMVVWGAFDPDHTYTTVGSDNQAGGAIAARHLLRQGRRRMAWFGQADPPEFAARLAGFLSELPSDISATVHHVPGGLTPTDSHEAADAFFAAGHRPDAIFAASDVLAISALTAATKHGISVPDEMAVIGFDDIPIARFANPPLTTVRQDIASGARHLVDLLMRRMAGEDTPSVQFSPELVERATA